MEAAHDVQNDELQVEAIASSFEDLYSESPTFRRLADYQRVAAETPDRRRTTEAATEPSVAV
jgi:hypothetical protein